MSAARRILITGASGFLGAYCVEAFTRENWEVVATGRNPQPLGKDIQLIAGDLLDESQLSRIVETAQASHLLHLAWKDDPRDRWTSTDNLDWAAASLRLARAFADNGGQRMVFAGSCAEYEWGDACFFEDRTPIRPASLYGASKAHCGQLLSSAASAMGISVAHARLFFCYGHGEAPGRLMPDLLQKLDANLPVDCTDGLQKRDYLYAADIANALIKVMETGFSGPINVSSGTAIRVRDLVNAVARKMGTPVGPQFGAIDRNPEDPPIVQGDNTRLRELGFEPSYTLAEGVADTIRRFQETKA